MFNFDILFIVSESRNEQITFAKKSQKKNVFRTKNMNSYYT